MSFANLFSLGDFVSFSCLIALARSSSTVLNKSCESGYPCLVSDLWVKVFILNGDIICDANCGFFVNALYQIEEVPFYF